jgi:glycyl-tRNA synthetase beta subunit
MRWGEHEIRWVRPLHGLLCRLDGRTLPVRLGPVAAGETTRGHRFNLLDARGAIGVTERAGYIGRVRALARGCCESWLASRGHAGGSA